MPGVKEQALVDPNSFIYSFDLGVEFEFVLDSRSIGMREVGIFATGLHVIFSKIVRASLVARGFSESVSDIEDEFLVSLEVITSSTGSWKGKIKIKLPKDLGKDIKDVVKEVAKDVIAAFLAGMISLTPGSDGSHTKQEITATKEMKVQASQPVCDISPEIAKTVKDLSAKGDLIVDFLAKAKDGPTCSIKLEYKSKQQPKGKA